jgi:hypothetical protein
MDDEGEFEYSTDIGPEPILTWVPKERCYVDPSYQREMNTQGHRLVKRIVKNFNWAKFGVLDVAPENEQGYALVDGQHRWAAAMRHPLIKNVPVSISQAEDVRDQAHNFVAFNSERVGMTTCNLFWAGLTAEDAWAVEIGKVLDAAGVMMARAPSGQMPPLHTCAISRLRSCMRNYGPKYLEMGLNLVARAHPQTRGAFRAQTIEALAKFVGHFHGKYDDERVVKVLSRFDLNEEIELARRRSKELGGSCEDHILRNVVKSYNSGLRSGTPRLSMSGVED